MHYNPQSNSNLNISPSSSTPFAGPSLTYLPLPSTSPTSAIPLVVPSTSSTSLSPASSSSPHSPSLLQPGGGLASFCDWSKPLDEIFVEMKERNNYHQEYRDNCARKLSYYVSSQLQKLKGEHFASLMDDTNNYITGLSKSNNINEVLTAICTIDKLLDIEYDMYDGDAPFVHKWSTCLRNVLHHSDHPPVIQKVSNCLARFGRIFHGTLAREAIAFEITKSLEGLEGQTNQMKRHTAVLFLAELIQQVPGLVSLSHVETFFAVMWAPLYDTNIEVRKGTVEVLKCCLKYIRDRSELSERIQEKIYEETRENINNSKNVESLHGSLLVLIELFSNSNDATALLHTKFEESFQLIFSLKEHKSPLIRRTVVQALPNLVLFNPTFFTQSTYLNQSTSYLVNTIKRERGVAMVAIGEIAVTLKDGVLDVSDQIFDGLMSALKPKYKLQLPPEVYKCVSLLARGIGSKVLNQFNQLIDYLFSTEFCPLLVECLSEIDKYIPELRSSIQKKLLEVIKTNLTNPEATPFAALNYSHLPKDVPPFFLLRMNITDEVDVRESFAQLSLQTLASFEFESYCTRSLLPDLIIPYLFYEKPILRKYSVLACSTLLKDKKPIPLRGYSAEIANMTLERLFYVGMTDPDNSVRLTVLQSLSGCGDQFDHYLSQPDFLKQIFLFLNDEVYEIQVIAISLLGRLSHLNPALINPILRTTIITFLRTLNYADDLHQKEKSVRLFSLVARALPQIVRPYTEPIISSLLAKMRETSLEEAILQSYCLQAIGDMASVSGDYMLNHVEELLPVVINSFQDQHSSQKRMIALHTLGELIESSGYVIEPLIRYPKLFDTILHKIKRAGSSTSLCQLIKLLGIIGAIDPYRYKMLQLELLEKDGLNEMGEKILITTTTSITNTNTINNNTLGGISSTPFYKEFMRGLTPQSEDYYPTVTLELLMRFLKNAYGSNANLQMIVIEAVMTIFRSMSLRCVPYLKHFMSPLKEVMEVSGTGNTLREIMFQKLRILVSIIQHYTRDYLPVLMQLMDDYWDVENLLEPIVLLLQEISTVLDEFQPCLRRFLPKMLRVLHTRGKNCITILEALKVFGSQIDDYLPLIIPAIVILFDPAIVATYEVSLCALRTIGIMTYSHDLSPYAVPVFQHIAAVLDSNNPISQKVHEQSLRVVCDLCSTVESLHVFVGMVSAIVTKRHLNCPQFIELSSKLKKKESIVPVMPKDYIETQNSREDAIVDSATPKAGKTNGRSLASAWSTSSCANKSEWTEWFRRVSISLLEESPSPSLRCCVWLAKNHDPVASELFNPAFLSCWETVPQEFQVEIIHCLESALSSHTIPSEILHKLLDLAEFMERSEKSLPLDIKNLGYLSEKCHAFAKALYYREKVFKEMKPTEQTIENLITITGQLKQYEAAQGIIKYAESLNISTSLSWHEKIQNWYKLMKQYEKLQLKDPNNVQIYLGRLRCLNQVGAWEELATVAEAVQQLPQSKPFSSTIVSLLITARFHMGHWEQLEKHIGVLDSHSLDVNFYRSAIAIHQNRFDVAQDCISRCRELASTELAALMGESYSRAYGVMVRIQQLAELEEIMTYQKTTEPERRATIRKLWSNRLAGVEQNVEVWQDILSVRSLVLQPKDDIKTWIKFANMQRKNRRVRRSMGVLTFLLYGQHYLEPKAVPIDADPDVKYAYLKLLWEIGEQKEAFQKLSSWVNTFGQNKNITKQQQARAYVKITLWQLRLSDQKLDEGTISNMINTCKSALDNYEGWHKAWHTWAILNYTVLRYYSKQQEDHPKIAHYLLPSVNGFMQAIMLDDPYDSFQDTLRLLNLWFTYGHRREVENEIRDGIEKINVDSWLLAIPQIIARINNPCARNGIQQLLIKLGNRHPQALVFPLTISQKSPFRVRANAAQTILKSMETNNSKLVKEAILVGDELIRTAILWKEKWYKGLEEASNYYYVERRVDKMMSVLHPLHEMLRKPVTQHESAFSKAFGKDLQKAWECCKEYNKTKKDAAMNLAWDLYAHIYRIIKRHLQTEFDKLYLSVISPALLNVKDLDLAVFGTYRKSYRAKKPTTTIKSFSPIFKVIQSKQKPRKLVVFGSDGNEYPFLLKGHEDLRQDQRVMQLFGLVNNLLEKDNITSKQHLLIQAYSVVPLSSDSGLIEWLPHSDTIHELITVYRKTHKIPLEAELTFMQRYVSKLEYYQLPSMDKLEIFEYAIEQTPGDDLERILWLNSKSSEMWLDKRTVYTRSLAAMSVVGYILGLGDRHPNNLMLNRNSGQIIHIDFGDCFEIAQQREKFAERVPFRLTRMLVNAMEVSGFNGTFSSTCEEIMRVLRENKESIKAVLEAFVYDPLLSWRLVRNAAGPRETTDDSHLLDNAKPPSTSDIPHPPPGGGITTENPIQLVSSSGGTHYDSPITSSSPMDWENEFTKHQGLEVNIKALRVLDRIDDKLSGRDFPQFGFLDVSQQVERLLQQATSNELLCQAYLGWCPYW